METMREKKLGIAHGKPEEKLKHVSLDGNAGHRITKRAKETNDMKSKKVMKNTKENRSVLAHLSAAATATTANVDKISVVSI